MAYRRPNDSDERSVRGRGAAGNPENRFGEGFRLEADPGEGAGGPVPKTRFYYDDTGRVIARNNSPDIGFDASINPYRGCEHGCVYCYARPTHEFLGFSAGLDFETKIVVKHQAPDLLRRTLSRPGWRPQVLAMSGVTDPYQPAERKLRITRGCLKVLAECRNPVGVITKNHLVTRDIDLLADLSRYDAVHVTLSITTLDDELVRVMEPRTSRPARRLDAIRALSQAGVPVGVNVAPVIPGLTDHELPELLEQAAAAGAQSASFLVLRLPLAVSEVFSDWLGRYFPDRRGKVLNRIRDMREGLLNKSAFGERMRGTGNFADQLSQTFHIACARYGLDKSPKSLSLDHFRRPSEHGQLGLF